MPSLIYQHDYEGIEQAVATKLVREYADKMIAEHPDIAGDFDLDWVGESLEFSGSVMGAKVSGVLVIEEDGIYVDARIPMIALPFRGRIRREIRHHLDKALKQ